jgi:lipoate-protein ligase A
MTLIWWYDRVPGTPEHNMAVDETLLMSAQDGSGVSPLVRVYTWDRDCISIGRLQDETAAQAVYPGLPLVRRPTGGRAVRHGHDLCISVIARWSDLPPSASRSIAATHQLLASALVKAFCALGIPAEFGSALPGRGQTAHVDCFAVSCRCDVIDGHTGQKLAGCAQRRVDGAILQQISIPRANLPTTEDAFFRCVRTQFEAAFQGNS